MHIYRYIDIWKFRYMDISNILFFPLLNDAFRSISYLFNEKSSFLTTGIPKHEILDNLLFYEYDLFEGNNCTMVHSTLFSIEVETKV